MTDSRRMMGTTRVAIQLATQTAAMPSMEILQREDPLVNIIEGLCKKWNLDDPTTYQLQFDDAKVKPPPIYITEENRDQIKDGDILKLDFSPKKSSQKIVNCFWDDSIAKNSFMNKLAALSIDKTFADHFILERGFDELTKFIINEHKSGEISSKSGFALSAFVNLMNHSIVSWDTLNEEFLTSITWYVDPQRDSAADVMVVKSALAILQSAITNSSVGKNFATKSQFGVSSFISNMRCRDEATQILCVSLVNTLLTVSGKDRQQFIRKTLLTNPNRQLVWESISQITGFAGSVSKPMAFQCSTLQARLFNLLSDRLNGAIKRQDGAALKEVSDLRKIAFDEDVVDSSGMARKVDECRDYTKLGFKDPSEPLAEFGNAPPGALALDCMAFFAHQYTQQYRQIVLENSRERADEQDCPFAQASVQLTQLLADILQIGVPPSEDGEDGRSYHPMFFFKEKPFEECFCVCIQRFTRTWKEMKASMSDFNKVLMVVKEQITRAFSERPHTFDSLKTKLTNWSFAKIQEARQRELDKLEEEKRQAKPIRELREMIKPEILEVIRQQRINRMIRGFHFKNRDKKKEKFLFMRLSHNAKVLQHAACNNDSTTPDSLDSINIHDILEVKESDDSKNRAPAGKSITVVTQSNEETVLHTEDQKEHDMWLDGLYTLTGLKQMSSKQLRTELDELLSMEIKLRLLDAEGIDFPDEPPPIPQPPADFNFVTA